MVFVNLCIMLLLILIAAEIFTNALEHLGQKLNISEGVTGSIFAAVGTALPETSVPIIALLFPSGSIETSHDIGVGSILGAPLMLSTIALGLIGLFSLSKRGFAGQFMIERTGMKRDLDFFIVAFIFSALALYIPHSDDFSRKIIGSLMVFIYIFYLFKTIRASKKLVQEGHATEAEHPMLLSRLGIPVNFFSIFLQLFLGLALLIFGAKGFVTQIEIVASFIGISVLVLSIMVVPIATELPEKVNSILWIRRRKDTLAFGNITGAMVFQGTLLPALGIILTPWEPKKEITLLFLITLISVFWIRFLISRTSLKVWHVISCGFLFLIYIFQVI
jgi:cation:H+ antiporter